MTTNGTDVSNQHEYYIRFPLSSFKVKSYVIQSTKTSKWNHVIVCERANNKWGSSFAILFLELENHFSQSDHINRQPIGNIPKKKRTKKRFNDPKAYWTTWHNPIYRHLYLLNLIWFCVNRIYSSLEIFHVLLCLMVLVEWYVEVISGQNSWNEKTWFLWNF